MKAPGISRMTLPGLFAALILCLLIPQTALCQTEMLGNVSYTPPKDWTKTTRENVVAFSQINQTTGVFCIITLFGATPGTGKPESDFKREWDNLVVKTLNAEPNPKTETEAAGEGWTATAGGASVEFQGGKSLAFLTVISGGGKTVSILAVFNDESYAAQLAAFSSSIDLEKAVADTPTPRNEEAATSPSTGVAEM